MKTAQIIVTSCSRRELELQQIRDFLRGNGFYVFDSDLFVDQNADLIFLSTCGFTKAAEDFSFETLYRINREKKQTAGVVLCGCIPEINPARVKAEFDGDTFSPQSYYRLNEIVSAEKLFDDFKRPNCISSNESLKEDLIKCIHLIKTFDGGIFYLQRLIRRIIRNKYASIERRKTFYIQIQEGCSMECSYCSIKKAIGKLRSKPLQKILFDFKDGLRLGYKEFQLVGDNAGSYGLDIGINIEQLLREISKLEDEFKIALSDINPVYLHLISEGIIELGSKGKMSFLYIPIQSASIRILKKMNRACDMDKVKNILQNIKNYMPSKSGFQMGTSLIVGFPSETSEDLQETIEFCKDIRFDWVWCHSFSARPETPAANLECQIDPVEIKHRARLVKKSLSCKTRVTIDSGR